MATKKLKPPTPAKTMKVFTFEVTMVVRVLATDQKQADEKLYREGGAFTDEDRTVKLLDVSELAPVTAQ